MRLTDGRAREMVRRRYSTCLYTILLRVLAVSLSCFRWHLAASLAGHYNGEDHVIVQRRQQSSRALKNRTMLLSHRDCSCSKSKSI